MSIFQPFHVLLPKKGVDVSWPVVACDQFTSEPEYWESVEKTVGASPSTLRLVFPEVWLGQGDSQRIETIQKTMQTYLSQGLFETYADSFVYVERMLSNGQMRRGIVGVIDLESYDFAAQNEKPVRATERTVLERIPPRVAIREGAMLELSHALMLADDATGSLFTELEAQKTTLPKLYELDLMQGGGKLTGRLVAGKAAEHLRERIRQYEAAQIGASPLLYCIGDGNHSLATAKTCFERLKKKLTKEALAHHPARYAMVELENIHDDSQHFEPIHRLVSGCDPQRILEALRRLVGAETGYPIVWVSGTATGTLYLDPAKGILPIAVLQTGLDACLKDVAGKLDYIHGEASLRKLASRVDTLGLLLPAIEKTDFFRGIRDDGVLPRKTFSMGEATDKRYYVEARRIL